VYVCVYLVKFETLKMHASTNLALMLVIIIIAIKCIKLRWQLNKFSQHAFKVPATETYRVRQKSIPLKIFGNISQRLKTFKWNFARLYCVHIYAVCKITKLYSFVSNFDKVIPYWEQLSREFLHFTWKIWKSDTSATAPPIFTKVNVITQIVCLK